MRRPWPRNCQQRNPGHKGELCVSTSKGSETLARSENIRMAQRASFPSFLLTCNIITVLSKIRNTLHNEAEGPLDEPGHGQVLGQELGKTRQPPLDCWQASAWRDCKDPKQQTAEEQRPKDTLMGAQPPRGCRIRPRAAPRRTPGCPPPPHTPAQWPCTTGTVPRTHLRSRHRQGVHVSICAAAAR